MIQGGDIEKGDGTGTFSIYGSEFEDENLNWREMDAAGLVCSANRGKDTNGSQYAHFKSVYHTEMVANGSLRRFFITLESCPHLNGKHTIFGRLVSGEETLERISEVDVDKNDRPIEPVLVSRCGELEKRAKKAAERPKNAAAPPQSRDRGRRRRSDIFDVEMENSPEPRVVQKHRRQSDNMVDEGLRGRPRQRSGSRSPSRPLSIHEEEDESSEKGSPTKKHKRKRSASPSRHADHVGYERRRRSLPNQYGEEWRNNKGYEDEDRYKPSPRRDDYRHRGRRRDESDRNGRQNDGYRPSRQQDGYSDYGRLGGGGGYDEHEPPVKFKGRGVMKYREPDRAC